MASPSSATDTLTGVLERIIFLNEETHFTIAEFRTDTADEKITITGPLSPATSTRTPLASAFG